jgi:hypothetical protein
MGRLVERGLHDELTGEAYALIDGTDGRAHHVRFRGIEAFEHAPPVGESSKSDASVKPAIHGRPWCSPSAPISILPSRSPQRRDLA